MAKTRLKTVLVRVLLTCLALILLPWHASPLAHPANIQKDVTPSLGLAQIRDNHIDWSKTESGNCLVAKDKFGFTACPRGDQNGYWNVALVGDSHMRQYFADFDYLARKYHWNLTYISKSACPVGVQSMLPKHISASCRDWNGHLSLYFEKHAPFNLIINSNSAFVSHGSPMVAAAYEAMVKSQLKRGTAWFAIWDNPKPRVDFLACIALQGDMARKRCSLPYSQSMKPVDVLPAAIAGYKNVTTLNLRSIFCPADLCSPIMKGRIVYRDKSHVSATFAKTLVGFIDAAIPERFRKKPPYLIMQLRRELPTR